MLAVSGVENLASTEVIETAVLVVMVADLLAIMEAASITATSRQLQAAEAVASETSNSSTNDTVTILLFENDFWRKGGRLCIINQSIPKRT